MKNLKYIAKSKLFQTLLAGLTAIALSSCNLQGKESKLDAGFRPGLEGLNTPPVAANSALAVLKNIVKSETLLATDTNSGDTLTYSIITQGSLGTAAITNTTTGAFAYTPNNNVTGSDSFTFKVNDGTVDSNTATVTVTIYDPNTAPVASAISPAAFNEDTQSGVITLSYSDVDADLATACTISNPTNVTVTQACACDGAGVCTLKVIGAANYFGAASFNYTVTANGQDSNVATATLSITAVNDNPTISAVANTSTNEDVGKAITFNIAAAETAVTCGASVSMSSTNTNLVPNANVVWTGTAPACTGTVTPTANEYGASDLTFTVTDGAAMTATTTFKLTVTQLGDDSFTNNWPFDFLSDALYIFTNTVIRLTGGVAELIGTVQTDSSATETTDGTLTAGAKSGVIVGTLTDGSTGLKLGNGGGCNGGSSDCAKQAAAEIYELNSSWTPQWNSLVSYWKMNESSWNGTANEVVDSKGSNHGTAQNSATTTASSKLGSHAGTFDGANDYVDFGSASPTVRTISFWLYLNSYDDFPIIYAGNDSYNSSVWNWSAYIFLNTLYLRGNSGGLGAITFNSSTLPISSWHHIVLVRNAGTFTAFVDGIKYTSSESDTTDGVFRMAKSGSNYFSGKLDEVAIWSTALSDAEVQTIYSHQSARYSGTFASRIMNAKSSASWSTLSWIPTLPFFKELPDYSGGAIQNEVSSSTTGYSSLVGSTGATGTNDLMSGIVGLWHLNEVSGTTGAASVKDDSGNGLHGAPSGGALLGQRGRFGTAASFDGVDDEIQITHTASLANTNITSMAWVEIPSVPNQGAFVKFGDGSASNGGFGFGMGNGVFEASGSTLLVLYEAIVWINTGYTLSPGTYHIAMVIDGSGYANVYVNGNSIGYFPGSTSLPITAGSVTKIGGYNSTLPTNRHFNGNVDEVAIWSRALHANEIKQLYQRGASRLKYQVRSCDDSACSGESWQGPDGTSGTYFSELNNNTTPLTGLGDVKAILPSMLFSNFTSAPANNQYFQYRTIFESDSTTPALWPELKSTTVDPIHYPTYLSTDTTPGNTIIGQSGVAFYDLNNFTQTLGAGVCSNGVVYNLGLSNTGPWKYWNGTAWATADDSSAQGNTAAALVASANAALTAFATDVGRGSVFFKAFLTSDGTTKCELSNVFVGGNR